MTKKKAASGLSTTDFYVDSLKLTPSVSELIGSGKRVTEVKSASDYSYHSSSYGFPHARVVGDAGCFIDPFFSSGVHLAMTSGLSAATTIAASIRGDIDESVAADWHTCKVREGYARFLLVVLSAYKQMLHQDEPILSDYNEDNFDRAFSFFRPGKHSRSRIEFQWLMPRYSDSRNGGYFWKAYTSRILQDTRLLDQSVRPTDHRRNRDGIG